MSRKLSADEDAKLAKLVRAAETEDMIPSAVRRLMNRRAKSKLISGPTR